MSYRSLISLMPKAQPLLLDIFPNAAVAYSLRKLRTAYSGSAIRVRRSVDNAEQDFGFNDFNSTLTDWVGYNLWTYSEQLQQAPWGRMNTTITTDAVVAPDGNTTADIAYETETNGSHLVFRQQLPVTAGKEYTVSFWVKPNGRNFMALNVAANLSNNNGATQPVAIFDLINGTKISDNGLFRLAPTITPGVNGWYFITYGVIANVTTSPTALQIGFRIDATTAIYVGDVTKGIAIWGSQISQTSTVKPYQRTDINAGGEGFVTTWYDQSGAVRNGTQASAANQCQIVSNGSLVIDPDNGKLSTLWTNDRYGTGFYLLNANNLVSSVYVGNRVSGNITGFGSSNNASANSFRWLSDNNLSSFGTATNGTSSLTGDFIAFTQRLGNSDVNMWINNTQQTSGTSTINNGPNSFGSSSNTVFNNGYFQEAVIWNGNDQSSNRTAIETNINSHYNIY